MLHRLQRAYLDCIKCQYETSASTVYSISKVCTFRLYHSLHSVQDCLWAKFRVPHVLNAKWSISFAKCKYLNFLHRMPKSFGETIRIFDHKMLVILIYTYKSQKPLIDSSQFHPNHETYIRLSWYKYSL